MAMDERDRKSGGFPATPHSAGNDAPSFAMPINACDCHMHVFDATAPFAAGAVLTHEAATVAQYRRLQKRLGTTRNVVVQPSSYGTDHRVMLAALRDFGDAARGIAVVTPDTPDAELERLAASGVVGARMNLVQRGATDIAMARPLAARLGRLGWHLQVHMLPESFLQDVDLLLSLGIDVVVDHFARVHSDAALAPLIVRAIHRLLASGRAWLKLSGAYMAVPEGGGNPGHPVHVGHLVHLEQLGDFVASVTAQFPSRLVWGTDWPHATEAEKPNDVTLANLLAAWIPDPAVRHQILVSNPGRLYHFDRRMLSGA